MSLLLTFDKSNMHFDHVNMFIMHVKNFLSPIMCLLTRVFYWKNPQNGHKSQFTWNKNQYNSNGIIINGQKTN